MKPLHFMLAWAVVFTLLFQTSAWNEKVEVFEQVGLQEGTRGQNPPTPMYTTIYPWPMQRYNVTHSGLSPSPAPDSNNIFWWNSTVGRTWSSPAIANGMIFIGSGRRMLAFYQDNGTLAWSTQTDVPVSGGYGLTSSPAYSNGLVFFAADRIYALYANNGTVKWRVNSGNSNYGGGTPTVAGGVVYVGGDDRRLYAINEQTGVVIWTFQTLSSGPNNFGLFSAPAIWNNRVYLPACDGYVYMINVTQPGPVASAWYRFNTGNAMYGSPVVYRGMVYIGNGYYASVSVNNRFYALSANDLSLVWQFYPGSATSFFSSAAVAYNKIFIGSIDGNLYALDPIGSSGTTTVIWQYNIGSAWASPGIASGKLFITNRNGRLYSFDANQSGVPIYNWIYELNGESNSSPSISDGKVCLGTDGNGGRIYCFGTATTPDNSPIVQAFEPGGSFGQSYTVGDILQVRWSATDDYPMPPNNINISYGFGGTWSSIIQRTANDGVEPWNTAGVTPGVYYINISAYDSKGQSSWDLGNFTFEIVPAINQLPTITILQPVGGESWSGGSIHNIDWTANDVEDPVFNLLVWVNYSITGVPPYDRQIPGLQGVAGNARPYAWTIPLENSAFVVLNATVVDTSSGKGYDVSATFEIDSTAPVITSTNPLPGDTGVPIGANVLTTWSEPMDRTSTESSFTLLDTPTWTPVAGAFSWAGTTMIFNPSSNLLPGTQYSANVTTVAKDDSDTGNYLAASYSWNFTTAMSADTTLPTISSVSAIPDPQEVYFLVNVSGLVQDNVAVGEVWLNVTDPSSGTTNITMDFDSSSGRHFIDQGYNALGVHTFVIWAADTSDNWNSSSGQFTIVDTTKPTITNLLANPDPVEISMQTQLSATVTDNFQLFDVWINITAPDTTWTNQSMLGGPSYYFDFIPDQTGTHNFVVSAIDTSNNWNSSSSTFEAVEFLPPNIQHTPASSWLVDNPINLTATVTSNHVIQSVMLNYTDVDGLNYNISMSYAGQDEYFYVVSAQSDTGTLTYFFWANDSNDKFTQSQTYNLLIVERRPHPPQNLAVTTEGYGTLRLNWVAPTTNEGGSPLTDLRGYYIYRMTQSGGQKTLLNPASLVLETTYLDEGLQDGTTYYYVVTAVNSRAVESADSNEASGTTLQRPSGIDVSLLIWIVIIVVVVVIVLMLLVLRKKKRKPEETNGDAETSPVRKEMMGEHEQTDNK